MMLLFQILVSYLVELNVMKAKAVKNFVINQYGWFSDRQTVNNGQKK